MNKVIAFGDSVMKGVIYDGDVYRITSDSFASMLAAEYGFRLINHAKMGHTIEKGIDVFNRMNEHVEENDLVLLEFGGNDCDFNWPDIGKNPHSEHVSKTDIGRFKESYCRLIERIKAKGARPLLFSLPPLESSRYFRFFTKTLDKHCTSNILKWLHGSVDSISNWHEQYNLAVFQVAIDSDTPIIDISSPILSDRNYSKYICQDGIHPNQEGHRLIFKFIKSSHTWIGKLINEQR